MLRKLIRPAAAALFSTTAIIAIAAPAQAQSLDVPAGSTHALTADESADTLSGAGEINLGNYVLTAPTAARRPSTATSSSPAGRWRAPGRLMTDRPGPLAPRRP